MSSNPPGPRASAHPALFSRLYVQFIIVAVLLLALEVLLAHLSLVQPMVKELSETEKKRLDIFLDLVKLLMTGSGLALGAVTGFVLNRDKSLGQFTPGQLRRIVASWGLAGVSLYCGYLTIQQVLWMLASRFFDLYDPHIWLPSRIQLLTLLASIAVFADFIHGSLGRQESGNAMP